MTGHNVSNEVGWGKKAAGNDPGESEDKYQKHVIVALWTLLGILIAVSVLLIWGEDYGLLQSFASHSIGFPSWPVSWP